jgi:excisionase family DNA binding protein
MALRSEELPSRLESLKGLLTSHEAAQYLQMTYWHFMHLVEGGRIPGMRVVDRWLFASDDLDAYRRQRYGQLEDTVRGAMEDPAVNLTERQAAICQAILDGKRPAEVARQLRQSRQAVHAQLGLIREKLIQSQTRKPYASDANAARTPATRTTPGTYSSRLAPSAPLSSSVSPSSRSSRSHAAVKSSPHVG